MLKASDLIAEGDLGAIVDYAIDINRRKAKLERELEELKVEIRRRAAEQRQGSPAIDLEGLIGVATVVFPGKALRVRKGYELRDLELTISREAFASLFRRTVVIEPIETEDYLSALEKLSVSDQTSVRNFVEVQEQTAKVNLPR